jgi:hypothetical protein
VRTSDVLELFRVQGLNIRHSHCITGSEALLELVPWVKDRSNVHPLVHLALQEPCVQLLHHEFSAPDGPRGKHLAGEHLLGAIVRAHVLVADITKLTASDRKCVAIVEAAKRRHDGDGNGGWRWCCTSAPAAWSWPRVPLQSVQIAIRQT